MDYLQILSEATPHVDLTFLLETSTVAECFFVTADVIRGLKSKNSDALIEGQDWIRDGSSNRILWGKAGVLKLADWIENSQPFKEAVEAYQLQHQPELQPIELDIEDESVDWIGPMLEQPADEIAWAILESRLPDAVVQRMQQLLFEPDDLEKQRLKRIFAPYRVDAQQSLKNAFQPRLLGGQDS